jgi:hypothetical protein
MFNRSRFSSYRNSRAVLWGAVSLATLIFVAGHSVDAASRKKDTTLDVPRPVDSYAIHFEKDHSLCSLIVASLNKEYRIDPNKLDDIPRVSLPSDSYLGADIQVPWTRKLVEQPDGTNFKITSLDVAQVTWKGHALSLFRRTVEKSLPETGALAINRIWMSDGALPTLASERTLAVGDVDRLVKGTEILVNVDDVLDIRKVRNLALSGEGRSLAKPLLLNIASVKERLFLLVIDAIQAEIAAPRATDGMIDLFVLEILSDHNIRAVCWLNST